MKTYICECGKEFTTSQGFNGHRCHCKIHLQNTGRVEAHEQLRIITSRKAATTKRRTYAKRKEAELQQWVDEKHICEHCGKVMTEKWGSGRFCSRSCANSRNHSTDVISRISKSVKKSLATEASKQRAIDRRTTKRAEIIASYNSNPNRCVVCNSILPYSIRNRITCSTTCLRELQSKNITKTRNRIGLFNTCSNYKYGTYKGIECDSSWELAFVMYLIDHEIEFKRNKTEKFSYSYENEKHYYYPDFIVNNVFYEIKSRHTDKTDAKISCFPCDKKLVILYDDGIKPYLDYAINTYGKDFYTQYDADKPSWMSP